MSKLFLFLLLCVGAQQAFAKDDTTRVLFIGNSFTYTYDVPSLVKGLSDAAGLPFKYVMYATPGATVGDTDQGTYAHMFNPEVFAAIRADNWDYVCLQENQGRFVKGNGIFPDPVAYKVIEGHFKIMDSVKFYHPCAHMLWFAGWAFKNGYTGISPTGKGLIDNIYQNYVFLKDTAGEIISPIGIAWERALDALPATDLWGPDEAHQSLAGSYLSAAVLFSSVYRTNIEHLSFTGGLDSVTAKTFRRIAYETVMDSSAPNNLDTFTPALSLSGGTLSAASGYTTYYWYRDGVQVSAGARNILSVTDAGCYQVIVTNNDSCRFRSAEQCTGPLQASIITTEHGIKVYPIPADDVLNIDLPASITGSKTIMLINADGRIIRQYSTNNNRTILATAGIPQGIYLLKVVSEKGTYHKQIIR